MNIGICDDEIEVINSLSPMIEEIFKDAKIITFNSIQELEDNKNKLDLLFLDIKFENVTGIDFLKKNELKYNDTKIVYITGYEDYYEDIFETNPFYLLMKPIDKNKIIKVYNKLNNNSDRDYIVISVNGYKEKIKCSDILYVESLGRKIKFYLNNKQYIECYSKLSSIIEMLPSYFIHIHKSYVINFNHIMSYTTSKVILNGGQELPISRQRTKEVREQIMNYI